MKENYFVKDKLKKIAIANYLKKKLASAGFIDVEIVKSVFNTRIVIYSLKPGFIIGKKGSNIRALTEDLEKRFNLSKVHIEIGEIPNKDLDPKVVMENIFSNIGRGIAWKSVVYGALRQVKEAGAIGAEIIAKGNTSGKGQRKRKSRFFFGYMKKAGDQKDLVAMEKRTTFPGLGTIGITLRIVRPGIVFSDKIDIIELTKNYKMEIQEEELLERQSEVKKDVEEKVEKKDSEKKKTDKKVESLEKDDTKKETVKKKVAVKKTVAVKKEVETKADVDTKEKVETLKKPSKEDVK
jgi:small subunit ribosomal protein S3